MVDNGGRDSGVLAIKKNCDFLSLSSGFFFFFLFFLFSPLLLTGLATFIVSSNFFFSSFSFQVFLFSFPFSLPFLFFLFISPLLPPSLNQLYF